MSGCMTARRCAKVLAWGVPGFLASMLWGEAWHYRMASFATWNLCCNFRSRSKSKDSVEVFRVARWLIRLSVKQRYPRLFKGGIAQTWWISIVARQVEGRFRWYHHTGYSHPGLRPMRISPTTDGETLMLEPNQSRSTARELTRRCLVLSHVHVDFEGSIYCTYQSRPFEVGWFKDIKERLIGEFSFQSLACTTRRYVVIHCISDQPFYFSLYGIVGGHGLYWYLCQTLRLESPRTPHIHRRKCPIRQPFVYIYIYIHIYIYLYTCVYVCIFKTYDTNVHIHT